MLSFAERKINEGKIEGKIEGEIEGRIEGEIEGRIKGKIEVLHTELGLSPEEIAKKLNLDVHQVKHILKQLGLHMAT